MRGRDVDDPSTTELRRNLIRAKPFLRHLYLEQYKRLLSRVPPGHGRIVELGAGAGFLDEVQPDVIRTDILDLSSIDLVCDATELPFGSDTLRAMLMFDVFHHIPDVSTFLKEAARVIRPGGVLAMVEPWPTCWSRLVYNSLHHEPFDMTVADWELPPGGALSGANGALPWIVFDRDRARFFDEHPGWEIEHFHRFMPFRYLASGGVSMRSLSPGFSFPLWSALEVLLSPAMRWLAMFAFVVLKRVEPSDQGMTS
jgi:SAM-dependent methyltransferase